MIARAASAAPKTPDLDCDVAVRSRHLLVAQAVGEALARRDMSVRVLPWAPPPSAGIDDFGDVMLLIDELGSRAAVVSLCDFLRSTDTPVLVLAGTPVGPAWGGVLDAGAAEVMHSTASLDEVECALRHVSAGDQIMPSETRVSLTCRWHDWLAEEEAVEGRLASLSPRESSVLGMLAGGLVVTDIAERLEVSESTVRSHVKALRRKLRVDSQLGAVALARRFAAGPTGVGGRASPEVPRPR